jgi:phospholipase C
MDVRRHLELIGLLALFAVAVFGSGVVGVSGPTQARAATASPIRHVVIIDMENQSFDSMFGKFCAEQGASRITRAGTNDACDGATVGTISTGAKLKLTIEPDHGLLINHSYRSQIAAIAKGKMNGFDKITPGCLPTSSPAYGCYKQFDPLAGACGKNGTSTCVPNGFTLAKKYALSDRMFELRATPSWAGHMVLGSATIERFVGELPNKSPLYKLGMPNDWGCDSGYWAPWRENGVRVNVPSCIPDTKGSLGPIWNGTRYATKPHAYYVPTIFDRLDKAGISWKIYQDQPLWSICPTFQECLDSQTSHVNATTRLLTDTTNHALPTVSWVIPKGTVSEHQPQSASKGDAWLGQIVSEIQSDSADWPTTAVFITWDDCGCFYDHVDPLVFSPKWGVRVPLLAVSPYARTGFTDYTPATFGSLLTFIEHNFSIAPLNPCATDPDPACSDDVVGKTGTPAYDLSRMFNYAQTPILAPPGLVTSVHLSRATRRYLAAHSVENDST